MAIDNIYELAALGELLEKKGLIIKQKILALAKDLKQKALPADPSRQRFTAKDNAVMEEIMEIVLHHTLTADQAKILLSRAIQLGEWGKQAVHEIPQAKA